MKWFKKNGILFSIFVALGLFSYFEFQKNKTVATKKEKSEKLFSDVNKEDILSIDFYSQSKLVFQLTNKNNTWLVIKPSIKDKADKSTVNIFLNEVFRSKKEKVISQGRLSNYELSQPNKKIIFYDANKRAYSLRLGSESFDKRRFILVGGKKNVFLSNSHLNFVVNKSFNLFRSKKLFSSRESFDKIIIQNKKNNIELYKNNNLWKGLLNSTKNTFIKLDPIKVDKFISSFKHLEAQEFIRENSKKSKKLLQQYSLLHPTFSLSVFYKNKKIWTLNLAQDNKKQFVYAKTSKRTTIYSISKEAYKSLSISLNDIRNLSSVFEVDKNNVDKVFYQIGKRKRSSWYLSKGQWFFSKKKQVENKKFTKLFSSIAQLKVVSFILKSTFKKQPVLESLSFVSKKGPVLTIQVRGHTSSQKKSALKDLVVLDLGSQKEYFAISSVEWKALLKKFLSKSKKIKVKK